MSDMAHVIVPKSDQWNFDDFQAGPITFTITGVKIKSGQEQPVDIALEGTPKFYRPCKSMARILVAAWGADSKKYVGRSLTLYGDPTVKWGGMAVGGIRVSHMSDIADDMTMALTVTRSNRKPFTVRPLVAGSAPSSPPAHPLSNSDSSLAAGGGANLINEAQESAIIDLLELNGVSIAAFLKRASVKKILDLDATKFNGAIDWIKQQAK